MTMELLNNVDHHDLRVVTRHDRRFGDAVNQVLALPSEFEALQRHYPIVFRKSVEGPLRPVAILGLDREENLFLGETDGWEQDVYVPAMLQRGPFSIGHAEAADQDPKILIDLDDPRVSRAEGTDVFLSHGGNSPYLENIMKVLRTIYAGHAMLDALLAALDRHALLRPTDLRVRVSETQVYGISEVLIVDTDRLAGLDGAALEALHRDGLLAPVFHAAASLANMTRLANRKARAVAAAGGDGS